MIELVIFDLDDTLYPEFDYVKSGFRAVSPVLSQWLSLPKSRVQSELWEIFQNGQEKIFDHILQNYGCWESAKVSYLVAIYRSHLPIIDFFPDAKEALSVLRSREIKIGVLTDGLLSVQKQKSKALKLSTMADIIVYTDGFGRDCWKPHPKPFQFLLANMGVAPDQAVYVGDNPAKDFIGARQLGLKTVHIKRDNGVYHDVEIEPGYEADCTITKLTELVEVLL